MQARGAAPCVACALARHVAAMMMRRGSATPAASLAAAGASRAAAAPPPHAAALLALPPQRRGWDRARAGTGASAQHAAVRPPWRSFAAGRGSERVADADADADADAEADDADAPAAKRPSGAAAARERALARALRIVNNRRVHARSFLSFVVLCTVRSLTHRCLSCSRPRPARARATPAG
jgi:hypothetical protein